MTIWFTADTHFGHANIIKLCNRPYESVEEMDETLIDSWNALVSKNDTVYFLGDFAFKTPVQYAERLNFKHLHIVPGNHDKNLQNALYQKLGSGRVFYENQIVEVKYHKGLVLCHYPLAEWPGYYNGVGHLYGHVHNVRKFDMPRSLNVGVDVWGYVPISLEVVSVMLDSITGKGEENGKDK